MLPISPFSWLAGCGLVTVATLISGCATTSAPVIAEPPPAEGITAVRPREEPEFIPVVRYGRYTLIELSPTTAQRDLLLQVIEVHMPEDARASVGDALLHVLKRSGYRMCETADAAMELYTLPLPAAHLQLGPMMLRDALLTLVGPAWNVEVDDRLRQVCFVRRGADPDLSPQDQPATGPTQAVPLAHGTQP